MLQHLKQRVNQIIPIKYSMATYLGALLLYSSWALGAPERLGKGLLIIILYAFGDLCWTYARDRVWYLPVSSWISGFILSLVAFPNPSLGFAILLPLLAVFSKQMLWLGKNRHMFNPAAFTLGLTALFTPSISWWGVAWGAIPLAIVSVMGVVILWRQGRWHVALPFLASYVFFLALLLLSNGIPPANIPIFLKLQLLDGTTIFFATVMLIEPLTSQFPTKRNRTTYGVFVGFFAVAVTLLTGTFNLERQDPLVYGLLLGNLTASLLFLKQQSKAVL